MLLCWEGGRFFASYHITSVMLVQRSGSAAGNALLEGASERRMHLADGASKVLVQGPSGSRRPWLRNASAPQVLAVLVGVSRPPIRMMSEHGPGLIVAWGDTLTVVS